MTTNRQMARPTVATLTGAAVLVAVLAALSAIPAAAAGTVGGPFALERLDLRFQGGQKVKVLPQGEPLRAEAEITFQGNGQLSGAWEIAEPTTTSGSPQFRTLELVSRTLAMGHREVLPSPPLPSGSVGAYLVRLQITEPNVAWSPPVLRYFVGATGKEPVAAPAAPPATIATRGPAAGAPADGLRFSWEPVAGSIAYQLEFYGKEGTAVPVSEGDGTSCLVDLPSPLGRPPVTGVMVPGSQTEIALGPLQARKLAAGKTYIWRIVALDKDGKALCESPLQEVVR